MSFLTPQIISIVLAIAVLMLAIDAVMLRIKIRKLTRGKTGADLETSIHSIDAEMKGMEVFKKEASDYFKNVEQRLSRSIQGTHTVRFNALKDGSGGNQSFASAFVTEKGDGIVFSSMFLRDRVNVYSKPLSKFGSDVELSDEEREAVKGAREKVTK